MRKLEIHKGKRFGRLTIINEEFDGGRYRKFFVKCDCGNKLVVLLTSLTIGATRSCGCLGRENRILSTTKHGHAKRSNTSKIYKTWNSMMGRCQDKNNKSYPRYGGRGISVSEEWKDFKNFYSDMGECPEGLSLERMDNNGNYCKENCKWADKYEQANNKRNVKRYTYEGETLSIAQWSRKLGISWDCLKYRLNKYSPEIAFTMPRFSKTYYNFK